MQGPTSARDDAPLPFSSLSLQHAVAPSRGTLPQARTASPNAPTTLIPVASAVAGPARMPTRRSTTTGSLSKVSSANASNRFNPFGKLSAAAMGAFVGAFVPMAGEGVARAERLPSKGGNPGGEKKAAKKPGTKNILILMSDTGGGHRASAEALKSGFEELYGSKYNIDIVDVWSKWMGWPTNQMPKSYSYLVRNPWMWRFNYNFSRPAFVHLSMFNVTELLGNARGISKCFDHYQPDMVVSVHPLLQNLPLRILGRRAKKTGGERLPFSTVVTDFTTCHECWFHKGVDACFVATEEAWGIGRRRKLKDSQMIMHGLPIRPAFSKPLPPKEKLRKSLGMDPKLPAVLIVGGGEGMGPVEETCKALASKMGNRGQVVVIAGRNEKLVKKLKASKFPFKITVNGFVSNMNEWMGACDAIVTKAGPGTIAEAMIAGLPIVLNGCVPCQEEGNIPWVLENKVGAYSTDPPIIAGIVADWFTTKRGELAVMAARAKKLGRPAATFRIVEDLAKLQARGEEKIRRAMAGKPALAAA